MENFAKKKIMKICLIGLGNIGFRHLQSILKLKEISKIDVIDIKYDLIIKNKIDYLNKNKSKINFYKSYIELRKKYDFCIISTNSDVRFNSLKNFYRYSYAKYLILEKFLFLKIKHYKDCEKFVLDNKIQAWINCPRRTYKVYKQISQDIKNKSKLSIQCYGNKWNMASNCIHYIDLFSYFLKSHNFKYDLSGLHKKLYKSNKKNFIEYKGTIIASQAENPNNSITLKDKNSYNTFKMIIEYDDKKILIEETKENINVISSDFKRLNKSYDLEKQSNLTNIYIKNILTNGTCELPKLRDSINLHSDLFKNFYYFYKITFQNKNFKVT